MQQVISVWAALDGRRRIVVMAATLAMFAAVLALTRMATTPGYTLLYAGLDPSAAGDVVAALEQRAIPYDVRGGSIFVEGSRRDELRMTLASEGLPASSGSGYELLDGLSGFGTTSQMFDAAYWRAKEGELARTIVASPAVRNARVHISNMSPQAFRRDVERSASVTLTPTGSSLSAPHARALRNLIASAVSGLLPENVSVIDSQNGQILGGDEHNDTAGKTRTAEMKKAVERLLEARVGYGNAVVEISIETVTEQESIVERTIDPDSRVAISTDTTELSNNSEDSRDGSVTVASNLPDGDADGGNDSSSSRNSETRERTNFEVSETQREVLRTPGAIRRLTVAVLVNGTTTLNNDGETIFEPRPEAEISALRELVSSAVGYDEERGDVITLRSMQFEPLLAEGSEPATGALLDLGIDLMTVIQLAVLALVSVLLGVFVVRPILSAAPAAGLSELPQPEALPRALGSQQSGYRPDVPRNENQASASGPALNGEIEHGFLPGDLPVVAGNGPVDNPDSADPVSRLRDMIEERQGEAVEVLRSWMDPIEERT